MLNCTLRLFVIYLIEIEVWTNSINMTRSLARKSFHLIRCALLSTFKKNYYYYDTQIEWTVILI